MNERVRFLRRLATCAIGTLALLMPGLASAQEVQFYHLDAIGNVRVVTNQAGQVVERHDYLPFGEECTTGPCAADTALGEAQPKHFTGKERDTETGLDYFGARYYGSKVGRFTTVDPLQVPGAVSDPQQWNRYAYARNNPLRYLDPTGLYTWDSEARPEEREAFRSALRDAGSARDRLSGSQREAVDRAIGSYGAEGEDNGVTVGFGPLGRGVAGETGGQLNPESLRGDIRVTFDLRQSGGPLAITVAHEGSHAADRQAYYAALVADPKAMTGRSSVTGGPWDLTKYDTETRAYNVSAFTGIGLGIAGLTVGGQDILNHGLVDAKAINRMLANPHGLYNLAPDNPGIRLSGTR